MFGALFGRDQSCARAAPLGIWEALQVSLDGAILFPNLQLLNLNIIQDTNPMIIELFAVESLESAVVSPCRIMLTDFATWCPNLSSVVMPMNWMEQWMWHYSTIPAPSVWQKLSRFVSYSITLEDLETFSQNSSSLKRFHFGTLYQVEFQGLASRATIDTPMLHALETMKTAFSQSRDTMEFIGYFFAGSRLRTLKINTSQLSSSFEWERLLDSLKMFSNSLTKLRLGDGTDTELELIALGWSALHSSRIFHTLATSFKLLTHIKLVNARGFALYDEDIQKLTEALPLLQKFCLYATSKIPQVDYTTTIAGLAFFAENCPYLSKLALGIDAGTGKLPRRTSYTARGFRLRGLDVVASPVDNLRLVSRVLFTIFPNLESVGVEFSGYDHEAVKTYLSPWLERHQLLKIQKAGRPGWANTVRYDTR